ncbi:hypothetical protein G6F43_014006 [Rhizopus delemar]|nr:hypothetical protein G6F43_014006 [Rhizopus delemar]
MATPRNPNISKYSTQNTSAVAMPNNNQPSSIVLNRAINPGEDSSDDAHFLDDIDFSQLTPDLIGEQPEQTTTSLTPQEEVVDLMTPQVEDEDIDLVESQDEDQNLNINEPPTPNTEAQFIQAVQFTKLVKTHRNTKQQTPLPTRVSSRTTKGKTPIRLGDEDFQ